MVYTCGIAGYKTVITGSSFVHHIGSSTLKQQTEKLSSATYANYYKFMDKWSKNGLDPKYRKNVIKQTIYSRQDHYFPVRIGDFNKPPSPIEKATIAHNKEMILVADWSNNSSKWRNTLLKAIENLSVDSNQNLHLWIPKIYFNEKRIINEVEKLLNHNISGIHYHTDEVPPIDLLTFFNQFDSFWTVEDDYVNRYYKYLLANADTINMQFFE